MQLAHFLFIGCDQHAAFGGDQALHQGRALALDLRQLGFQQLVPLGFVRLSSLPDFGHDIMEGACQRLVGAQGFEQRLELLLDALFADGLAALFTALGLAEVIAVARIPSFGEGSRHGPPAAGAGDDATQGEVLACVLAKGSGRLAPEPFQYALVRFEAHQRLMLAFLEADIPFGRMDVPRIDGTFQNLPHALDADALIRLTAEVGKAVEIAFDLDLACKTPARESFQNLPHDGGVRLVRHQHFAMPLALFMAVADGRAEHPIAVHDAGAHLLARLTRVLLALQLRLSRDDRFNELALRRILELEIQTFAHGIAQPHLLTQLEMEHGIARITLEIVEDDDISFRRMVIEIAKEFDHAGPFHEVALSGDIIREDVNNGVASGSGIFPAARFLRVEAMTVGNLPLPGDAAINEGFGWMGGVLSHGRFVLVMGWASASSSASRAAYSSSTGSFADCWKNSITLKLHKESLSFAAGNNCEACRPKARSAKVSAMAYSASMISRSCSGVSPYSFK